MATMNGIWSLELIGLVANAGAGKRRDRSEAGLMRSTDRP